MYRYEVEKDARLIVATFEGEVSDADFFEHLSRMLANTTYSAGWRSLIDLTSIVTMGLTSAGVQRMRALPLYMEERLHGARAAIVAPADSAAFEMASLYARMGQERSYEIRVFTDREAATRWLLPERTAT